MIKIKIFTENKEIISVCELYWTLDSNLNFLHNISELAELAKIDKLKIPAIVKKSCNAYVNDWICVDCEEPHVSSSRSDFIGKRSSLLNASYLQNSFVCSECRQKRRIKDIKEKEKEDELTKKVLEAVDIELRKEIQETYQLSNRELLNIQSLSLTDAIYLISILRGGADETLTQIYPVSTFVQPLSSDDDFSSAIINYLHNKELIFVHPESEPKAFVNDDISRFYIYHVHYAPPLSQLSPDNPKSLVTELFNLVNAEWSEEWCQEALEIWKNVALHECKEYLMLSLKEHHFDFSLSEKTTQYLEYALEHFSTAQVYNTIWRAVKDAAAYYQRERISKRHASNLAISSIQRISERAIAENWDIKPYKRNYKCPPALVSEVLYNLALKLGDDGFQVIPNIETIRAKKLVM
jgi:hypothetical protein